MIRYIKIVLVFFVALQGLVGAIGNILGLSSTHATVAAVLSLDGIPDTTPRLFEFDAPLFAWLGVAWIAGLKLLTGITGAVGTVYMWQCRNAFAADFNSATRWGLAACGFSILMLFGGFIVVGVTMMMMWRTEMGQLAFEAATYLLVALGVVALFLATPDD